MKALLRPLWACAPHCIITMPYFSVRIISFLFCRGWEDCYLNSGTFYSESIVWIVICLYKVFQTTAVSALFPTPPLISFLKRKNQVNPFS